MHKSMFKRGCPQNFSYINKLFGYIPYRPRFLDRYICSAYYSKNECDLKINSKYNIRNVIKT